MVSFFCRDKPDPKQSIGMMVVVVVVGGKAHVLPVQLLLLQHCKMRDARGKRVSTHTLSHTLSLLFLTKWQIVGKNQAKKNAIILGYFQFSLMAWGYHCLPMPAVKDSYL